MTEQEKREKVIKGLECCNSLHNDSIVKCATDCPYYEFDAKCRGFVMRDALALLKAKEPIKPLKMEVDHVRKEPVVFSHQCPVCMTGLQRHWVACPNCGQVVKW